jgi:sialate O-acetylesterase
MMSKRTIMAALATVAAMAQLACAAVTLPRVLSSHMVLQRDMPVPIWGSADPGERVTVSLRQQEKNTTADANGAWRVTLDPLQLGEPTTLTVSGSNTIALTDVLVGEVWVGSGQSNLDTNVPDYTAKDAVLRQAATQTYPQVRLYHSVVGKGWQLTTPETVRDFSAQMFYFGISLQKELNVPVGLMEGAVRGTPAANWITEDAVKSDAGIQKAIADWEKAQPYAKSEEFYKNQLAQWQKTVDALPPGAQKPNQPWRAPPAGYTHGPRGDQFERHIRPMIPFAIRGVLWDQGEGGTNIYGVDQNIVMHALIQSWRTDWGEGDFPFLCVDKPSGLGCALNPNDPINQGAATFTELPKHAPQTAYDANGRIQFIRISEISKTFVVPVSDLSPGIHPPFKSAYGIRDCQVAMGAVYGKDVEYSGPVCRSYKAEGSSLRITFSHVGKGLAVPEGEKLQGFAIAGADKHFVWADGVIDGQSVVLSSPDVASPVAACYAWAYSSRWANLFNKDGLPAVPFRAVISEKD